MKILLAADGSKYTRKAARELARMFGHDEGVNVHLLHVHAPLPYPGAAARIGKANVERYQEEESVKALKVAERELEKEGVAYTSHWTVGDVARAICDFADKNQADLIVMGSHGNGGLAAVAMGSVALKVIAASKYPVMVVP